MWLVVLFLGVSLNPIFCEDDKNVVLKSISEDALKNNIVHHPPHVMHHGVERPYKNPQDDPHRGNAKKEAHLQQDDMNEFWKTYGAMKKNRLSHSRISTDKMLRKSRGRYRRAPYKDSRKIVDSVGPKPNIRRKRFFGTWMLWEKGLVPYTFGNLTDKELTAARDAMKLIELYTCIRFIESDGTEGFNQRHGLDHDDSLLFVTEAGGGCWSQVGHRKKKQQEISACDSVLTAVHELSHALGAFHEHESYDIIGNVEKNEGNIEEGMENNFNQHDPAYRGFFNVESYDLQSLMHYEPYDFSGNGLPTLDPLYPDFAEPADDYWLLMKETSHVYSCWDNKCSGVSLECGNEGYKAYFNNSCQCTCPEGLDPNQNCNQVLPTGCGGIFELTKENPSQVIKAPTMDQYTGSNYICYWIFKSPGRIKLNIMEMKLDGNDRECLDTIQIRRNLLGQSGSEYCGDGFEKSIFSTGHYLAVTLRDRPLLRADFLASGRALFEDESCYNWNDRGETYNGALDIAEDYTPCIHWSDATNCSHNPFFYAGDLKADFSGNYCRNPGGVLHRPWCYTDVRPTSCTIKYCEPCQIGNVYDRYDNCDDILRRFDDYCNKYEEAKCGCRKTCDMPAPTIVTGKCRTPKNITGASLMSTLVETYDIGSFVKYQCDDIPENTAYRWCLSTGEWSDLGTVCDECVDQLSTCEMMLKRDHTMCSKLATFSNKYCASTCGKCGNLPATCNVQVPSDSSKAKLVTRTSTISQGEYAEYACVSGFFLKSGDMTIVCMKNGVMYGQVPTCSSTDNEVTPLSDLEVKQLQYPFLQLWGFIGKNRYTTITRAGAIKTWYFYCVEPGEITLAVFRTIAQGTLVVGTTETECDAGHKNTRKLDGLNEIHVEPGDYVGVVDEIGGSLTFTMCEDNSIMSHVVFVDDMSIIQEGEVLGEWSSFPYCAYAAINADIGPISNGKYRLVNYYLPSL